MIIPSIDILEQRTVQLVGGETLAIDAGDPRPLARRFGRVGEVAAIDLDAARGTGSNRALIEALLPLAPLRVGGGIRDAAIARSWLDAGAAQDGSTPPAKRVKVSASISASTAEMSGANIRS